MPEAEVAERPVGAVELGDRQAGAGRVGERLGRPDPCASVVLLARTDDGPARTLQVVDPQLLREVGDLAEGVGMETDTGPHDTAAVPVAVDAEGDRDTAGTAQQERQDRREERPVTSF